jgi:hypothetical protein
VRLSPWVRARWAGAEAVAFCETASFDCLAIGTWVRAFPGAAIMVAGFHVEAVPERRWSGLTNGDLIQAAEELVSR